jgi:hypothetical protein
LEVVDHFKEIAGLRIAARAEHAHEALRRSLCPATQFLETERCVDMIAKYRFSGVEFPYEQALDAFS